eukprot:TRINITY_DN5929_c0_g1_i2.p1 TRINITY_DN5929_c0_g1~~TRINITY_DN5929_c0_g1_i2.p1  ORF type:complete len:711 (+),score=173.12 TRINITY_DN5929_c0_g1_i2:162-2135(+)
MASVGNGYLATIVGTNTQYISGVFNGLNTRDPSHRARIPATLAITVAESTPYACALDLQNGIYYRRSTVSKYPGAYVEQKWYVHRTLRNVAVHVLTLHPASSSAPITVSLSNNAGSPSSDFNFTATNTTNTQTAMNGYILVPEEPGSPHVHVALSYSKTPATFTGTNGNATWVAYSVAYTSLEEQDPVAAAHTQYVDMTQAAEQDVEAAHKQGWAQLWVSGIEVGGDLHLAQAINSSLYYILSSVRDDWHYSLSPGGLASNGYNGHSFWDVETWMFPSLALLYQDLASSVLQYRFDRIPGAQAKAKSYTPPYAGAMFPWESAFTGQEVCPSSAPTGQLEQHISGDIAYAVRLYWFLSGDDAWMKSVGWPIVQGVAEFYTSRVVYNATSRLYSINGVIPPDEYAVNVNNSVYTNVVAVYSLQFATQVANHFQQPADPKWSEIASSMIIPFDTKQQIHPEFEGYHGQTIKQADVVLLGYPLAWNMSQTVLRNDLEYYSARTDSNGPAMTYGIHAVLWLQLGEAQNAASLFERSYANIQAPFCVWTETPQGGTTNFITGAGGFLQAVWAGYGGVRVAQDGVTVDMTLPEGTSLFALRGVQYVGSDLYLATDGVSLYMRVLSVSQGAPSLTVHTGQGTHTLTTNPPKLQKERVQNVGTENP